MSVSISEEIVFACGRKLLLAEDKIIFSVGCDGIEIKFPTTRKIAETLEVPHYYVLPYFSSMEEKGILTRTERVGIYTTPKGTKNLFENIGAEEKTRLEKKVGKEICSVLFSK